MTLGAKPVVILWQGIFMKNTVVFARSAEMSSQERGF